MSEKEALQRAADEARKVARTAREFAGVLDDYAKYLTQPAWRERADELHLAALNKLSVINNGLATLAACNEWVEESSQSATAQPSEPPVKSAVGEKQNNRERTIRIKKEGSKK